MMTKEEVREIMIYCEGQKISYKTRLHELDIPFWKFYDTKHKHIANDNDFGGFLELLPSRWTGTNPNQA